MGLIEEIHDSPVGLDTSVFVYFIEEHPLFLPVVDPVFGAVDAGRLTAITSSLTLLEVLVVPYRARNLAMAERYEQLLTESRGIRMVDIDRTQLRAAANLRAAHPGLRTPDAIQVSAALLAGCRTFVTNDRRLPALPGLRVIQLNDYTGSTTR